MLDEKGIRVLFVCGGTGGHIIPAINLAEALRQKFAGTVIYFAGTKTGMEDVIVPAHKFPLIHLKARPFRGGILKPLAFLLSIPGLLIDGIKVIKTASPEVVVGTGGYVSFPVIAAAKLLGIPTLIHIQNVVPGLASLFLSLFATEVHVAFLPTKKYFWWRSKRRKTYVSGNPIHAKLPDIIRDEVINELNLHADFFTILITGGSQGSRTINRVVLQLLKGKHLQDNTQVIWQTGKANYDEIMKEAESLTVPVHISPFQEDMAIFYSSAQIVVCRAGAITLSEVASWGIPAIIIPFMGAGGHQLENAKYFENIGAGIVITEKELTVATLSKEIGRLKLNDAKRNIMVKAARKLSRENGINFMVNQIIDLAIKRR